MTRNTVEAEIVCRPYKLHSTVDVKYSTMFLDSSGISDTLFSVRFSFVSETFAYDPSNNVSDRSSIINPYIAREALNKITHVPLSHSMLRKPYESAIRMPVL